MTKHSMTGLTGNSEFCLPSTHTVSFGARHAYTSYAFTSTLVLLI